MDGKGLQYAFIGQHNINDLWIHTWIDTCHYYYLLLLIGNV
uniref:Uncharacterized protein n=1 Tax=Syphacia muris TaxID=451379 RepID=A0A0N5AX15_9BILA